MSEKILPCPFCGSNNITVDVVYPNDEGGGYGITCSTNGCMGNIFRHDSSYSTEASAIQAWNRRLE